MKHTTTNFKYLLFTGILVFLFTCLQSAPAQTPWKAKAFELLQKKEFKALHNWCKQHITYDNTFRDSLEETLSILDSSKNYSLALEIINKGIQTFNYKDLWVDQYVFEQSLRPFHSTASTTIPNDQQSFSEFCYGGMVSCKEGNAFACAKTNAGNYNLY